MKKLLMLAFILFTLVSISQNKDLPGKENKTIYYFKVDNVSSFDQLEEMRNEITSLHGVIEFKGEFKAEKKMGQLIIIVLEKAVSSEGDKNVFSPVDVKKIIISHNLAPAGFQSEKEN